MLGGTVVGRYYGADVTVVEDDGAWVLVGDVHLDEVERAIGHTLPEGDYETVSGLLIATHGALPEEGDVIVVPIEPQSALESEDEHLVLHAEVLEVDRHVPARLRLTLAPAPSEDAVLESAAEHSDSRSTAEGPDTWSTAERPDSRPTAESPDGRPAAESPHPRSTNEQEDR